VCASSTAALADISALERRIFGKSNSWADHLPKEVTRRGTLILAAHLPRDPVQEPGGTEPTHHAAAPTSTAPQHRKEQSAPPAEQVAGYLIARVASINVHLSKIAVREGCRRRGVGRALMMELLRRCTRELRCQSCTLHVDPSNIAALTMYRSLGFQDDGLLVDYYSAGRPAIKMILDLQSDT